MPVAAKLTLQADITLLLQVANHIPTCIQDDFCWRERDSLALHRVWCACNVDHSVKGVKEQEMLASAPRESTPSSCSGKRETAESDK